jgi:hypothetical protein
MKGLDPVAETGVLDAVAAALCRFAAISHVYNGDGRRITA